MSFTLSADSSLPIRPHTVRFLPSGAAATAGSDETLLAVARRAGLVVDAPCGGEGTCGKCVIRVPPTARGGVHMEDNGVLTVEDIREGLVLSCQTMVAGDVEVFIPDAGTGVGMRILTDGYTGKVHLNPHIRKRYHAHEHATLVYAGDDVIGEEPGDTTREVYAAAVDIGTTTLVASLLDLSRGAVVATESSLNQERIHRLWR